MSPFIQCRKVSQSINRKNGQPTKNSHKSQAKMHQCNIIQSSVCAACESTHARVNDKGSYLEPQKKQQQSLSVPSTSILGSGTPSLLFSIFVPLTAANKNQSRENMRQSEKKTKSVGFCLRLVVFVRILNNSCQQPLENIRVHQNYFCFFISLINLDFRKNLSKKILYKLNFIIYIYIYIYYMNLCISIRMVVDPQSFDSFLVSVFGFSSNLSFKSS